MSVLLRLGACHFSCPGGHRAAEGERFARRQCACHSKKCVPFLIDVLSPGCLSRGAPVAGDVGTFIGATITGPVPDVGLTGNVQRRLRPLALAAADGHGAGIGG